jgi:tRNA (guanine10-N2)-methyltransferase
MCNLALASRGSLVLDPCAGTGSILLAAAARGAHVVGADIDAHALWGRPAGRAGRKVLGDPGAAARAAAALLPGGAGPAVTAKGAAKYAPGPAGARAAEAAAAASTAGVADNFRAARAAPAALLIADMARLPLRPGLAAVFDAVIADPPYGVRAGGRTQAPRDVEGGAADSTSRGPARSGARFRAGGRPAPTAPYDLGHCMDDLLSTAARLLRRGGRLVFFLPTAVGPLDPALVPAHPALASVAVCEQPLTRWYSRRLVALEKVGDWDPAADAAARASAANAPAYAAVAAVAAGVYGEYAAGGAAGAERKGRSKQR